MKSILSIVSLLFFTFSFNFQTNAQNNIAPLGTFTSTGVSPTFPPSRLNDLDFGTCGTQQFWMSTSSPPSLTPGVDWIQVDFSQSYTIDQLIIHHASSATARFMSGATIQFWNGSSWVTHHSFSGLAPACSSTVVFPPMTASRFRLTSLILVGPGQLSNPNFREIEIIEVPQIPNDAQPISFDKPGQAICNADKDVEVSIENKGLKDLTSVEINWTVIRGNNTFPVITYNWNGNLPTNSVLSNIPVGNFAPGFENDDIFKVWTSNPNGVQDSSADNDTLELVIREGISGEFNVGGFFNVDFANLKIAEQFVDSFGAVCDSLIFNVRDGIYTGQLGFEDILGSSPNRPIVFRAENGANANVVVIDSTNTLSNNYVLKLSDVNYIYFENITFRNLSSTAGRAVFIDEESTAIGFSGCGFENSYSGTNPSNDYALVTSSANAHQNIAFSDCSFNGGTYGMHLQGKDIDTTLYNISVEESNFVDQLVGAIYIDNAEFTKINHNTISSTKMYAGSEGIAVLNNFGELSINNNTVVSASSWPTKGIHVSNSNGFPAAQGYLVNNFVKVGDTASSIPTQGIIVEEAKFLNLFHNSVLVEGTDNSSVGFIVDGGGANKLINNNISNMAGGVALFVDETSGFPLFQTNHNNYHSSGLNIARYKTNPYQNIPLWSASIGDDAKSISANPGFISSTDLHICGSGVNNLGLPLASVPADLDGQPRNVQSPDLGADEFQPISNLDLGNDTVVCKGSELVLYGALNYNDLYTAWSTGDSGATLTVTQPGTYSVSSANICGSSSDTIVISLSQSADLGTDTNICSGASITLDAKVVNGTYLWNTGETSKTVTKNEDGIYIVTVTDQEFCTTSDTIFVTQSIKANLPNDTAVCGGQSIFLDPGTGQGVYAWSNGATTPVVLANVSDTISVNYTDVFGCSSADTIVFVSTTIPNAEFTSSSTPGSPATVIFSSNTYPDAEYFWNFGDGDTSMLQNPIHLYPSDGTYLATLQISNACGSDFYSQEFEVTNSTEELSNNLNIQVFPNPTSQFATITLGKEIKNGDIQLLDLNGKLLKTINVGSQSNLVIDVSDLSKGQYMLKGIFNSNEVTYQKAFIVN